MLHIKFILGDTSCGKSSLINEILNEKPTEDRMLETTLTFVKLRNSDRVRITTESDTGNIKEKDFTEKCDLESKDGVKVLRDYLKNMSYMTASRKTSQIRSVVIGFPNPFLKITSLTSQSNAHFTIAFARDSYIYFLFLKPFLKRPR